MQEDWGYKKIASHSKEESMGEMKQIYGPEFGEELMASALYMPGMESMTGIPYQGRPEFGTIELGV